MNPSKVHIRIVTEDEITAKAANFSLSSCPPVKVEERLSAREAANVCRDLEAHLNILLPKDRCKNLQVFVPASITDDEGNTLTPSGKLARRDDFLSAPSAKEKKVKKVENDGSKKLVHHATTIRAFAMIKVALPLTNGDLPASLALVEQARAAFEARANARVESEDKEDRAGVKRAAGDAARVAPVKSIERGPAMCSQDWATAVHFVLAMTFVLAFSVIILTLTGVVARTDAKKFFATASDVVVFCFLLSVCMIVWAIKNGWVQNPESFMSPFRFLFKAIVQRIS